MDNQLRCGLAKQVSARASGRSPPNKVECPIRGVLITAQSGQEQTAVVGQRLRSVPSGNCGTRLPLDLQPEIRLNARMVPAAVATAAGA